MQTFCVHGMVVRTDEGRRFLMMSGTNSWVHLFRDSGTACEFMQDQTNRLVTPAMEAGIANHVWSIDEIVSLWVRPMRYARRSCEECTRLAAERAALYQQYLDAKDALTLTQKNAPDYPARRKHLDKINGQLGEARKREDWHEQTHQDKFSR